ncbi:MAG: asparaginase domain-containing protein [Pleomorphochaeta sp.]
MKSEIRIITTGGTFDKQYNPIEGQLTFVESQLPKILKDSRCTTNITLECPIAIDSLYMNEQERKEIVKSIFNSLEEKVLVIHGTDTMSVTAELAKELQDKDDTHTVVFTGAMVPYSLKDSDAVYNLGCAQIAVQLLPPGIYICMNGKVFEAGKVYKDKKVGIFKDKN